ncbi:phosphotransferase [Legionella sp. 16cNR16C]|uniref:phosphotransferase n=1 Tax=Legionella sp. 16cNR16C TaxID=2905656 RepID=UPI001E399B19|nr:phosphotransferase [Legionella sp. 16cNR16C]MCE3044657.1 phosphotransferase [Legionella sp. 16cNR16C]
MPEIEWSAKEKAFEWDFAKKILMPEGRLLPDGNKLRRKDYPNILNHSFIIIDRQIVAMSGKGSYLGAGINGHAKLAEEESGHLIALKVVTSEKEAANSAEESKVAQDLGIAGQRATRTSCSKKYPLKHYIAYQFLGIRLFEYLDRHKASLDQRYELAIKIALALQEIHTGKNSLSQTAYIHGDIHGKNIVVDEEGTPHLIDYGRARRYDVADADAWRDDIVKMLHVFFTSFSDRIRWYTDWIFGDWLGEYQFEFYPPPEAPSKQTIYVYLNPKDVSKSGYYSSVCYAVYDSCGTFQSKIIQLDALGLHPLAPHDFKEECRFESIDDELKQMIEIKVRELTDKSGYTTSVKDRNNVLFDLLKKPSDFYQVRSTPTALDVAEILSLCRVELDEYQGRFTGLSAGARLRIVHNLNEAAAAILALYKILNSLSGPHAHIHSILKKLIVSCCLVQDETVFKDVKDKLNVELATLSYEDASKIKNSLDAIIMLLTNKNSWVNELQSPTSSKVGENNCAFFQKDSSTMTSEARLSIVKRDSHFSGYVQQL